MKRNLLTGLVLTGLMVLGSVVPASAQTWVEGLRFSNPQKAAYIFENNMDTENPWIQVVEVDRKMKRNMNLTGTAKEMQVTHDDPSYYRVVLGNENLTFRILNGYGITESAMETFSNKDETALKSIYTIESPIDHQIYMEIYSTSGAKLKGGWKTLANEFAKDSGVKPNWSYRYIADLAFIGTTPGSRGHIIAVVEYIDGKVMLLEGAESQVMKLLYGLEHTRAKGGYPYLEDDRFVKGHVLVLDRTKGETVEYTIDNPAPTRGDVNEVYVDNMVRQSQPKVNKNTNPGMSEDEFTNRFVDIYTKSLIYGDSYNMDQDMTNLVKDMYRPHLTPEEQMWMDLIY